MTDCELRGLLVRIDAVRSRIFSYAVSGFCCCTLIVETIRHPTQMADALFWPGIIIAGVVLLHYAVKCLVKALQCATRLRFAREGPGK